VATARALRTHRFLFLLHMAVLRECGEFPGLLRHTMWSRHIAQPWPAGALRVHGYSHAQQANSEGAPSLEKR
jgi:hypothetical protein